MKSLLSKDEKTKLLETLRSSGQTQAAFAEINGINPKTLARWIYQQRLEARQNQNNVEFVELKRTVVKIRQEIIIRKAGIEIEMPSFDASSLKGVHVVQEKLLPWNIEITPFLPRTGICVISNAFILKAKLPEVKITVDASCCACVTPESHKTALSAMKLCQINVIGEKKKPQKNNGGVYKLYTELEGFKPKIYRTFLIKKNMPMLSLASCMISMFDGNASHIYDFDVPSENLNLQVYFDGETNASDDEFAIEHKHIQPKKHVDVRNYKVKDCLKKVGDKITFTYDFGDDWTFPIRLEEIIDDKVYEEASPLVLEGEGLGIIEDVGGVGTMSDCVKAFEKKSGDDYESYSEWLGIKNLDITYFNKNAANKSLKNEIKAIDKAYKTME